MKNQCLSIVVPAFNEANYITDALKSIRAQTYNPIELIVVNNNSSDQTESQAKPYADRVINEPKKGYVNACITGCAAATGQYISICPADARYHPTWAASMIQQLEQKPSAVAVYGTCRTYDASRLVNQLNYYGYTLFLIVSRLFGLDNTADFNFIMKKSTFDAVGGYLSAYKKMSPDIDLGKRLKTQGALIFDRSSCIDVSFRRHQSDGFWHSMKLYGKAWLSQLLNRTPTDDAHV